MIQTESLDKLFAALSAFQGEVPNLFKSDTVKVTTKSGGSYNFKYVPLEEAVPVVRPLLSKHGLSVTQLPGEMSVLTVLAHSSGQHIGRDFSYAHLLPKDANSQAEGGLITYFRRYAFMAVLGLVADEDDDSNAANGNSYTKTSTKPSVSPQVRKPVEKPTESARLTPPAPKKTVTIPDDAPEPTPPWEEESEPTPAPKVATPASDYDSVIASMTDAKKLSDWFNTTFRGIKDPEEKTAFRTEYAQKVMARTKELRKG